MRTEAILQTPLLEQTQNDILESVSPERLMEDTRAISRWARLSGTPDELRAFEYVAGVIRGLGLEPELEFADAFISLPGPASLRVGNRDLHPITHSMAASTPPSGISLELIDVGAIGELQMRAVTGKATLIDGMANGASLLAAQCAGAAAVVFANADEHVHEMIVSNVWGSPVPADRESLPRIPAVTIPRSEAVVLRDLLAGSNTIEIQLTAAVDTGWRRVPTLTAQLDGTIEPERFVLFSGHIDSWHYGAMDNGSANATMLETLRVLLPHRDACRRSLRLAFWSGHSHGRYAGSTWYADAHWEDLHDNCVLHLNVDSVGGQGSAVLTDAPAMAEARDVAADVIRAVTGVEYRGSRFTRAGDQSFQGHGIPSLFMSLSEQPRADRAQGGYTERLGGGLGWWWHTLDDTIDKIAPVLLERDARIYALVAYRFLSEPVVPLDVHASASDLLDGLRRWNRTAGDRFDLSHVVERAQEVTGLAARFRQRIAAAGHMSHDEARQWNAAIQAVERPLVRLNYVGTDEYSHDAGIDQPPVPLLAPIEDLILTQPGDDDDHQLTVLLTRRRNTILHGLSDAMKALEGERCIP